jgi:hypothetical protein
MPDDVSPPRLAVGCMLTILICPSDSTRWNIGHFFRFLVSYISKAAEFMPGHDDSTRPGAPVTPLRVQA